MHSAILHVYEEQSVDSIPSSFVTRCSKQTTSDDPYFIVDLTPAIRAEELYNQRVQVYFEDGTEFVVETSNLVGFI